MSEQQAQQLIQQMQMLESHFAQLTQQQNSIISIIREANSAIHSINGTKTETESDGLVPIGMGVYVKSKIQSKFIGQSMKILFLFLRKDQLHIN